MARLRGAAVALMVATPAATQDIGPALNPTTMIGYAGTVAADMRLKQRLGIGTSARPAGAAPARRPAAAPGSLAYPAPSPEARQTYVRAYLDRARRQGAEGTDQLATALGQHDYAQIYDGIARPYGLAGNDAGKALAAYMLLGWTIVHGGEDPPVGALQGVAAQAARALADPGLAAPAARAKLGEELKLLFVTVHAGWQAAQREGTLDRYTAGVAAMYARDNGLDLRALRLGPGGFQRG